VNGALPFPSFRTDPMTTRGRLDEVSLHDLLQILSSGLRTGKLTLSHRGGFGTVLFRNGRVIYAASNRPREAFGGILVGRGLIDAETLHAALEAQNHSPEERRLGSILLEMGAVAEKDLRRVMEYQVCEVLRDFLSWKEAYFKFQAGTIPDRGEIGVDCYDLVLDQGLTAEGVLVATARRGQERTRQAGRLKEELDDTGSTEALSLLEAMAEVRSPTFTGEIELQILRFAAQVLARGVLFAIGRSKARPIGKFGIEANFDDTNAGIRHFKIPLDQPSIVGRAAALQETVRGPLERTTWNERLAEELGGVLPQEAVAIPLTVNGATAFVLYGDNLTDREPFGSLEKLEALLIEAGLAIEKAALETRVRQIETGDETLA